MNTAVIRCTNCLDCPYCEHNGMLQAHPKYICGNKDVYGRNKVDAKYWYDQPIVGNHKQSLKRIDIPDWCPILEV